jgi:Na+(H+)/acetate symporter ActP
VVTVGVLMLAYVVFGGMVATTWVQIIKAVLLVAASIILVFFTWLPYGFSLPGFLDAVVADPKVQAQVAKLLGDPAGAMSAQELGQRFLEPGLYLKNPIDQISLGMALVLGTAGMPHILMRFFTVPTAQDARKSVIWAMGIIGGFYVLTLFLGLAPRSTWARPGSARSTPAATWRVRCWRSTSAAARTRCWEIYSSRSSRPSRSRRSWPWSRAWCWPRPRP